MSTLPRERFRDRLQDPGNDTERDGGPPAQRAVGHIPTIVWCPSAAFGHRPRTRTRASDPAAIRPNARAQVRPAPREAPRWRYPAPLAFQADLERRASRFPEGSDQLL